jgi:hypothetical protein
VKGVSVSISPDQLSSKLDAEFVILDFHSGWYYGLNETGSRIWELISTPRTVSSIVQILLGEYDCDPSELRADVEELLCELEAKGLIQVHEGGPQDSDELDDPALDDSSL